MTSATPRPSRPSSTPARLRLFAASLLSYARADLVLDGGASGWDTSRWRAQVDGVMGGRSSGRLRFESSNRIMSFAGTIVTDGGGFSSVRKERFRGGSSVDLTPYAGVVVTLETTGGHDAGDAKAPLGMHLQLHDTVSSWRYASAYAVPLAGEAGVETSVYLPLESFDRATRIGRVCDDCRIDFSRVNEMDLYVLFQEGPFDVRVKEIRAVDGPQAFPSPAIDVGSAGEVRALIEATVESAEGLYDYGYVELCNAVYRSTLNTLLAAGSGGDSAVSETVQGMICQGLQRAATQGKNDMAYTLHYTAESILEELGFKDPGQGWRPDAVMREAIECTAVTSGASIRRVTSAPTQRPSTKVPTKLPTIAPTMKPTMRPTMKPTLEPTVKPTRTPSEKPTSKPSMKPTLTPTTKPTTNPSMTPTTAPTMKPTTTPSMTPSTAPTNKPSMAPMMKPTTTPSMTPTMKPTVKTAATFEPTIQTLDAATTARDASPSPPPPEDETTPVLPDSGTVFVNELESRPASVLDENSYDASSPAVSASLSVLPCAGVAALLSVLLHARL